MAAEERCSKLAMELEDTTESACEAKQSNANLPDCLEELAASLPPGGDEPAADENHPRTTWRTTRASRATRTTSATRKEATDGESDCRTRAQRPRRVKKSVAVSEDPLDDDDDIACRGSVLVDGNSEFSPLKCPGEMVVGMFSRSSNDGATASTCKTRRLLPPDQDFVEVEDEEPPPSALKTTGCRRAKH
ncbi:uncharacterized protein LOC144128267 [Amblyomma americanum]